MLCIGGMQSMNKLDLKEIKEQNSKSAKAMGFLFAAIIASLAWGFYQGSLPAFLLAGVFLVIAAAESRAYRKNYQLEINASNDNRIS